MNGVEIRCVRSGEDTEAVSGLGYRRITLSALDRHHEALSLYRSIGFTDEKDPSPDADKRNYVVPMVLDLG